MYLRADNYSWESNRGAVYVVDVATGISTLLTNVGANNRPVWSPDGTQIAFASNRDGDFDIYVMDADGSNVQQVTNLPFNEMNPSWQRVLAPPNPDADDDGVDDSIQTGTGAFDDADGTTGSITDANGLEVLVSDADDSGDGVKITVTGSSAVKATFTICGFTVKIAGGSEIVITCGSVTVEVVEGAAEIELGDGVVVSVPEGGTARVTDDGDTFYSVENLGSTDVTVTVDGTPTVVPAGETTSVSSDVTDPTVTCNTASFLLNQPGALVTATVSDGESGPAPASESAAANVATVGNKTVALTGEDEAGNTTNVSCPYRVSYRFLGFQGLKPSYKRGAAIPVKFMLANSAGTTIPDANAQALLTPCRVKITLDGVEQPGCATYNASSNTFQYDLKTSKSLAVGNHTLAIKVSAPDGSGVVNTNGVTIGITS